MPTIKKPAKKATKKVKKAVTSKSTKMELATLQDLFLVQMKDLYDTEKQIVQALPKVIKKASSPDLKEALSHHLKETGDQIERLERIYQIMGMSPKRKTSLGMKGLIDDSKEVMGMKARPELMDAAIAANSRHIEHHEIAGYLATIEWAKLLGMTEAANLLAQNLAQEEAADQKLTMLAESYIDPGAAALQ